MADWYKITISFRGAALSRDDAVERAKEMFDGMPLLNLVIDAREIPDHKLLRMIDAERAKLDEGGYDGEDNQ